MNRSAWVHPLLAAVLLATPMLAAQRPGGVEIGAFGSLGSFTPRFDLQVGTGGGGRIGYFLGPAWEIELEGSVERASVEGGGKSIPLTLAGVQALYNFGDDRRTFYLLGGYARSQFRGTPPGRFSDKDGVHDGIDRCPDTPAGVAVDGVGCPIATDSDGDGVDDSRDKCPGTPAGTPVDALGCQILFRKDREALVLYGVTFVTGRSRLEEDSYGVLDQVAASLIANPEVRIEIAGYTDSTGSTARNTRLSAARALAVRAYLARRGVAPERMRTKGYGPANPVASNATPEGRAQNRRVELHQLF